MIRHLMFALLISFEANAQVTGVDLYKQLQGAINLPLIAKATPPNQAYEARLYSKSGDAIHIIEIVSEAGPKKFFTFNHLTNEAKPAVGAKAKSNGLNVVFNQGHYQFVCSYGYYVVD